MSEAAQPPTPGTAATSSSHVASDTASAALALDLRIRLLEALVGLDTPAAKRANAREASIARRGQAVVAGVYDAVDGAASEAVKRFLETYELNKPLLVPQLPASLQASTPGSDLTSHAKAALLLDSEQDIRTLERELREVEVLDARGVAGAGKLAEAESLKPRLAQVQRDLPTLSRSYSYLESRVEQILTNYDDYVNTVSQLFINWNDAITQAEITVSKLERERNS